MNNIQQEPAFLFEKVLKRTGKFYISQKTLDDIKYGFIHLGVMHPSKQVKFDEMLKEGGYMLEKLSDTISVIKAIPISQYGSILDGNLHFWQLVCEKLRVS